jgi:hypothetical protein
MKQTLLWIFLALFFGIAAFEAALLVAIFERQSFESRLKTVEQTLHYFQRPGGPKK